MTVIVWVTVRREAENDGRSNSVMFTGQLFFGTGEVVSWESCT